MLFCREAEQPVPRSPWLFVADCRIPAVPYLLVLPGGSIGEKMD